MFMYDGLCLVGHYYVIIIIFFLQVGIVSKAQAFQMAEDAELDLVCSNFNSGF